MKIERDIGLDLPHFRRMITKKNWMFDCLDFFSSQTSIDRWLSSLITWSKKKKKKKKKSSCRSGSPSPIAHLSCLVSQYLNRHQSSVQAKGSLWYDFCPFRHAFQREGKRERGKQVEKVAYHEVSSLKVPWFCSFFGSIGYYLGCISRNVNATA